MRPGASSATGTHSPRVSALTGNFGSVTQGNSHLFWLVASARRSRTTLSCEQDFPVDGRYLWGRSRGGFLGKFWRSVFGFLVDIEWVFREKLSIHNDFWVNNKSYQQNPNDFGPQTQLQNPQTAMPVCVCVDICFDPAESAGRDSIFGTTLKGRKEGRKPLLPLVVLLQWWFRSRRIRFTKQKAPPEEEKSAQSGDRSLCWQNRKNKLKQWMRCCDCWTFHRSYRSVLRQISMIECTNQ